MNAPPPTIVSMPQQAAQRDYGRQEARPHRLHDEHAPAAGGLDDAGRFFRIDCEGLFTEYRLAARDAGERVRGMQTVGRRDVDRVDAVVLYELLVTSEPGGDPVLRCKIGGGRALPGGNSSELVTLGAQSTNLRGERRRHASRAENSPSHTIAQTEILYSRPRRRRRA